MAKKVISGYTEDWLPVRGIQNGFIITTNNQKVTGVKITPRNIFILDPQAQDNVLISLKNFYNMLDFEFWLVVADRPVDISVYMAQLQLLYNEAAEDRKSTRLNSSHVAISYAVFCLKKKKKTKVYSY